MDDLAYTHIQPTITSEKITATPTATSWAQTYHAGHLFAVLSLTQDEEKTDEEKTLAAVGKDIINSLEEEYFTLETKSLSAIKDALQTTVAKIPKEITASLLVAAIIANPKATSAKRKEILYLFVLGKGQVALKRNDTITPLLQETSELTGASGFLQDDDIVVVQTESFISLIPKEKILTALSQNKIADAAETLAPLVHETENGGACAIFINYRSNVPEKPLKEEKETMPLPPPPTIEETPVAHKPSLFQQITERIGKIKQRQFALSQAKLKPKKILFLGVAILIAAIFVGGIMTTIQKQKHAETVALFQSIYPEAQKKYDEGQSLTGLNKNLAHDNFLEAEKILKDGQKKFPQGSNEYDQIASLLKKTEEALNNTGQIAAVDAKETDAKNSPVLEAMIKNTDAKYAASDEKNVYLLTADAITTSAKKTLIKNDNTWSDPAGIGVYLGSLYVLDRKAGQLIKFPVTSDGFGKQNYFTSAPDLSKASSLAIDGSVFILSSDGTIAKFTKGTAENFKVTSVDKGLKNPSAMVTTIDGDKLYVLDNGNSRIVVLNKSGTYQAQYQTKIAASAKTIDVNEKDKKIFLLNGNKVYEIEMK